MHREPRAKRMRQRATIKVLAACRPALKRPQKSSWPPSSPAIVRSIGITIEKQVLANISSYFGTPDRLFLLLRRPFRDRRPSGVLPILWPPSGWGLIKVGPPHLG